MTFSAFKNLHQRLQTEHLARHGHLLAQRQDDSCELTLYAVADFYAEVWRPRDEEEMLFIHVFQKPAGLNDYLELVRLPPQW
jgi:hypothetical protein